jgi:hypothetical protein
MGTICVRNGADDDDRSLASVQESGDNSVPQNPVVQYLLECSCSATVAALGLNNTAASDRP